MTEDQTKDSSGGSEERIRKVYVKDLREKDRVHTVFLATKKVKVTARSGKAFLSATLRDKTGELDARAFDRVDEIEASFAEGDYLLVQGHVILFQGRPQIVMEKLERLDPEPISAKEFLPSADEKRPERPPPPPREPREVGDEKEGRPEGARPEGPGGGQAAVRQIREIVERVEDPHVRALLLAFLDDEGIREKLPVSPAAKGVHHAYRGGLADHLLSVMKLAHRIADHYPMADRDLLIAGALLHDICKVFEISADKGFHYTDEGKLVGHLVMTAQLLREKTSRISGFPKALEQHLTHIVIAHHGHLEFGSPKLPMTLEAQLVHLIDLMDSRVASFLELMTKDSGDRWTDSQNIYSRQLYKGPSPTRSGRSPVDRKPKRTREEREARRGRQEGRTEGAPRTDRPERAERPDRPERKAEASGQKQDEASAKSEPAMPTFKTLDELVPHPK